MIKEKLEKWGQTQLLKFEKELSREEKEALYKQIEELDFSYLSANGDAVSRGEITPIKAMTVEEIEGRRAEFEKEGLDILAKQEVGALLLAGGMGTRLGSDNPKGMYNIGLTKDVFIFQRLIENLLDVVGQCGKMLPLFIMTSDKNHEATVEFLKAHKFFGYDENYVRFFIQETAPCVDLDGKILLEEKGRVATSPNGNGGWFNSLLANAEAKAMLDEFGIKWLNVFAVDNVLQRICDPAFVGATVGGGYEIGSKVIRKVDPYEKVGVMCNKNGKPSIVEYIDLTDDMAVEVDEKGERVYNFGVILNYLFKVELLQEIKDKKLPVHIVTKKVPYVGEMGETICPETPNAHKFELLCVDMIEFASSCLPFEVVREKEFAPIKNKTGVDSVDSARALLIKNGYTL